MESSARAFRRNLEPFEDDRPSLLWHCQGCGDPVSERRYLMSRAPVDPAMRAETGVFAFRCASATAIAPDGCMAVIEMSAHTGRLEILTSYAAPLPSGRLDDHELIEILSSVTDTLARFDAHAFCAAALRPELVGIDENGRAVLLPGAYAFPSEGDIQRITDPATVRAAAQAAHVSGFVALAESLADRASAALAQRLRSLSARVQTHGATSVGAALAIVRGETPARESSEVEAHAPLDLEAVVRAVETGQVVDVSGAAGSGRTRALARVLTGLRAAGLECRWIDEWDVWSSARRKGAGKEAGARGAVWLVDDADERPLLHAAILEHAGEMDRRPGTGLVIATGSGTSTRASVLESLGNRAPHGVFSVVLAQATPADPALDAVEGLDVESRQILELLSIAAVPLPFDVVHAAFPGADGDLCRHVHALAGANLLVVETRRLPPAGGMSIALHVPSASLRRQVVERIPEARRRNLHRTIARMGDERASFAPMFVYDHLARAGETGAAASAAVAFVKDSTRPQRAPFLGALVRDLIEGGWYRDLSYGDRLALLVRLGDDLLARGRQTEAEALLTRARKLRPSGDELRAHAALASEAMRLLADAWSGRGQIREALDLLEDTREDIASYLSLADQARLLNDVGWLQYRLGDYSSCVDSCKFTVNTLNPNDHPLVVAQALNLLGVVAFNTSRYDEAVSYYEQSAFLREREHDQNALAGSYNNLALAYQAKGEYDKALDHLHRSIDIKRHQNNEAGIAGGYLNLALLYLEVHNFDEAERRCRESLRISSALGLAQLVAENHNTLGDIVFTRGQLDEAETYYQRALEHARRLSTVSEEMGAQKRLAKLYLRKARHAEAHTAIDEASRLARQVGSKYEHAQTEEIFGDLQSAEGQQTEAVDHFERAAALYATLSKYRMAAACFAKAGLAQAGAGGTLEAKRYLDRAQDLIKSQIGHDIPEEIVTLQQAMRERLLPSGVSGTESQKLLYAFYELSSLSDYADEKGSFFRRIVNVFRDLTGARAGALVLQTEEGQYTSVSTSGDHEPVEDPALRALLARALQLGAVLHPEVAEASDLFARVSYPGASSTPGARDDRLVVVPMKSLGKDLGCVLLTMPVEAVPRSREDMNFISCIGRHVAGDLRLSLHLDERSHKEETLERELNELGAPVADRHRFQTMIGRDEAMKKVFRIIDKVKDMDTGILIFGESGTGKTELARTIHYTSPRRRHVFQSIHCAEIPTSLLESELFGHERGAFTGAVQRKLGRCEIADGGTVFLDDVNVMPLETQSKLLHYLETKSFTRLGGTQKISTDVRLIAASNEDLERLVKEGRFREDLFYRLKVVQIELPALRERTDDMILIAQEFLKKRCQAQGKPLKRLSTETIKLFQKYRWPGNVRELQNVLEQIVLLCDDDIVEPSSLPEDFLRRSAGGGKQSWQSLEQLVQQMVESGGYSESNPLMPQIEALLARKMAAHLENKTRAASLLGITKPTLYSRLRGYDRLK